MILLFAYAAACISVAPNGMRASMLLAQHDSVRSAPSHPSSLTGDILTRMTTFWTHLQQEPDSIQTLGRQITQAQLQRILFLPSPTVTADAPKITTFSALAARYPAVAGDLTQAGLTAAQWDEASTAFYRAVILNNHLITALQRGHVFKRVNQTPSTAVDTANLQFLNTHSEQGSTLIRTLNLLPLVNTVINNELHDERDHQALNP